MKTFPAFLDENSQPVAAALAGTRRITPHADETVALMNRLCRCASVAIERDCDRASNVGFLHRPPRVLMVVAHPDDEVIGAGARLPWLSRTAIVVHVTDGAPQDLRDAITAGFRSRDDYADARRRELLRALSFAGVSDSALVRLGFEDQAVVRHLRELVATISALVLEHRPEIVLTHPYEGGHPDHDAVALAARTALDELESGRRDGSAAAVSRKFPILVEMTSYHLGPEGLRSCEFLPPSEKARVLRLTPDELALKQQLFACFETQQHVLRWFRADVEAFRVAPEYDFSRPPHPGQLFYEHFSIGMSWREWRECARSAIPA